MYEDPHKEGVRLSALRRLVRWHDAAPVLEVKPTEFITWGLNRVRVSFDSPEYTVDSVGMGTLRLLEAIRDYQHRTGIEVRFYQAGSSEMFGLVQQVHKQKQRRFIRSPYACARSMPTGRQ